MKFTVTYRKQDGSLATEVIDAADRAAAVAACRARGITPQSIVEGGRVAVRSARPAWLKGAVAGVAVVVAALAAWFLLAPKTQTTDAKPDAKKPAPAKQPPKTHKTVSPKTNDTAAATVTKEDEGLGWRTNRWGEVVRRKKPETYKDASGVLRYVKGNGRVPNPEDWKNAVRMQERRNIPVFKHPSESEIATLLSVNSGEQLVGGIAYDANFEQDFLAALKEPVEYSEDDTEQDRVVKAAVEEAKKELAERVRKGEKIGDILRREREEIQRLAAYRQSLQGMVMNAVEDSTLSDADVNDYFKAANKMLSDSGLEPIRVGGIMKKREKILRIRKKYEEKLKEQEAQKKKE